MSDELVKKEEKIQRLVVKIQIERQKNDNKANLSKLMLQLENEKKGYDELVLKYFENRF